MRFLSFFAGKNAVLRRKIKNPIKMCDLFEKTIDFGHRMRFFKIFARQNRGGRWQNSKGKSLWFLRLGAAGGGLAFSLPFWAFFLQKIQKWFAVVVRLKCFKNEKTREKTRQKKRERLKNKKCSGKAKKVKVFYAVFSSKRWIFCG